MFPVLTSRYLRTALVPLRIIPEGVRFSNTFQDDLVNVNLISLSILLCLHQMLANWEHRYYHHSTGFWTFKNPVILFSKDCGTGPAAQRPRMN